jgi:hypothetical protein
LSIETFSLEIFHLKEPGNNDVIGLISHAVYYFIHILSMFCRSKALFSKLRIAIPLIDNFNLLLNQM